METFVKDRLEEMLKRPKMWGSYRAVELQILLLLEVFVLNQGQHKDPFKFVEKLYHSFLSKRFSSMKGMCMVADSLGDGIDDASFVREMSLFIEQVVPKENVHHIREALETRGASTFHLRKKPIFR